MDGEIRPAGEERFEDIVRALSHAFGEHPTEQETQRVRSLFEVDRTLVAVDDGRVVGAASISSRTMTVPGGQTPVAAVVSVGVTPTHRRRGLATMLMRRQLDDLRDGGEPLAVLWASEGAIYQRYGYGLGILQTSFAVDRRHATFLHPPRPAGDLRLIDREEALEAFPPVYDAVRPARTGFLDRTPAWWRSLLADPETEREGRGAYFHALHRSAGGDADGYIVYRIKQHWEAEGPEGLLEVVELMAASPGAYGDLWRYVLDIDLVGRIEGWKRPVDEALPFMLVEPRRFRLQVRDANWIRPVDVRRALEARRYTTDDGLVLEVRDGFCPWNEGRVELEGGPDGATCRPTDRVPDLVLGAEDVGATILGGVRFSTLGVAGRIEEATPGALRRADAMFSTDPAPWAAHVF